MAFANQKRESCFFSRADEGCRKSVEGSLGNFFRKFQSRKFYLDISVKICFSLPFCLVLQCSGK